MSDQLRIIMTNTYTGVGNFWNTTAELYNVDTNTTIASGAMDNWESANIYTSDPKLLRFDNQLLGNLADDGATSVTISQVVSM